MNTIEHDEMDGGAMDRDQELRAKLCAVLLGEADEATRVEVEAALASSEELRTERARLEATIGLVSSALKEDASGASELSPNATAALQAAAAKRARPTVWYRANGFRIAASFALFAGVVMAWKASMPAPTNSRALDTLAKAAPKTAADGRADSAYVERSAEPAATPAPAEQAAVASADERLQLGADVAQAESKLNFEQTRAAGEVTGKDFGVVDGVESDASRVLTIEEEIAELREQQKGGRKPHSLYQEAELKIAKLEAAKNALEGGQGAEPSLSSQLPSVEHYGVGTPTAPPAGSDLVVTQNANGSTTYSGPASPGGAVPPRESIPVGEDPGTTSAYSSRRAGPAARHGGPTQGGRGTRAGEKVAAAPKPTGATQPGLAGRAGDGKLDASDRAKLRELGYVGDEDAGDKEVLGRSFDDQPRDRFEEARKRQLEPDWHSRYDQFRYDCRIRPNERPRDVFFRFWGDNPFEITALDHLSTFSADVDTASYARARADLLAGHLPEKAQVRTEEFVNYFKGDVPPPIEGTFRIATELAPSLFGDASDQWMLRVAIRGRDVPKTERQPLALTFVIDVSGSMKEDNRLELVKLALRQLVNQLDARDSIALVKFSTDASLVLPMTSAAQRTRIESAIQPLVPDGSTNTEAGLRLGYDQAVAALTQNATNRVVLLTDGVANVGLTDPNALVAMVESQRKAGIYLNTVGVGMNNHNDNLLEQLADKGDGLCNYVDDEQEVKRALVDNFTGALVPIARDVKIQVEFDPAQVERYRLLGYENRAIADADFRNDKVDAGELNSGHQVVALYEIVRRGNSDGPLATVRLRYKQPFKAGVAGGTSDESIELAQPVLAKSAAGSFAATGAGYRRSVLVAQFAEFLRRSIHARYDSLDRLIDESKKLASEMSDKDTTEFVGAVVQSRELVLAELNSHRQPIERCFDELRHRAYLLQQIDELERRFAGEAKLEELDRTARDLDRQLDQLRMKLESLQGQVDDDTLARLQAENIELQRKLIELLERTRASSTK